MQDTAPHLAEGPLERLEGRVCAMDEPPCSPQPSPPLQPFLLLALLSSGWKGLIQPPAFPVLPGSGFPPGSLSSAPQAAPCPGAAGAHTWPWLLAAAVAAVGFYPPAAMRAAMSPLCPSSARGVGKQPAKPAPCLHSWHEK